MQYAQDTYTDDLPLPAAGSPPASAQIIVAMSPNQRHLFFTMALKNPAKQLMLPVAGLPCPYARIAFTSSGAGGSTSQGTAGSTGSPKYHLLAPGGVIIMDVPPDTEVYAGVVGDQAMQGAAFLAVSHTETPIIEPVPNRQTDALVAGIRRVITDDLPRALVAALGRMPGRG